jgi:hypothetical protein
MAMDIYRRVSYCIPIDAVDALLRIQVDVPEALLAGGCIRDCINNVPVNDFDIFVPEDMAWIARRAIKDTHPKLGRSIPEPYFTHNNDVRSVSYYEGDALTPVNIIGVTRGTCTPEQQLERFDFGICRVAFDGDNLWKDLSFDRDMLQKTFTLTDAYQTCDQLNYSLGRFERLSAKYQGWKLVRPEPKHKEAFHEIR